MSLLAQFKTDSEKELNGVEIVYGANDDGTIPTFTVARMGRINKRYTSEMSRLTKPVQRLISNDMLSDDAADAIHMEAFLETILLDWKNVVIESDLNGTIKNLPIKTPIPFSKANARELFTVLPELYEDLRAKAVSASSFHDDVLDAIAKN